MKRTILLVATYVLTLLAAVPARAQLNGSHTLGDFGVQSATQPAPGFYAALFYLRYDTDTIKNADGDVVRPAPNYPSSLAVTRRRSAVLVRQQGQVPGRELRRDDRASLRERVARSAGLPARRHGRHQLQRHADPSARPGLAHAARGHRRRFAGLHTHGPLRAGGSDNIGKGMWTYEPFVGATVYFDEKKTFSLATTAYWEFHGRRRTPTSRSDRSSRSKADWASRSSEAG